MDYQTAIGLEIHAELKTKAKMFCSCKNDSGETRPNLNVCPICMGHPGTLPVINKEAVLMVIKTALALTCKIENECYFERKNYFYPDLPKGYQISQYKAPIGKGGYLKISMGNKEKKIKIQRVHLEEDTAKLLHPEGKDYSLVDFNRAGIPLMELVTEPDISLPEEAHKFAQELQILLRYLDISEADMEKGQMRVEVNISLSKRGQKLGTKVEIKNLNSFRAVKSAIEYEIERQKELLKKGQKIIQETRGWDEIKGQTLSQRIKEEAYDYRYFPEPDLPPLNLLNFKSDLLKSIPELPSKKRERFEKEYQLSEKEIEILMKNKKLCDYFEEVVSELFHWMELKKIEKTNFGPLVKLTVNYLESDLLGEIKEKKIEIKDLKITPENFAELVTITWQKEISSRAAKIVLEEMVKTGADPSYIIKEQNLKQVFKESEIEKIVKKILKENQKAVKDFKSGRENALQFLIGQVMRKTKGKMDPKVTKEILIKLLKSSFQESGRGCLTER